jgi:two-component system phosphate regulon sensor histidine kinase PhoR
LNGIWGGLGLACALICAAALAVWTLAGAAWALGTVTLGLGLGLLHHVRNLAAFARWTRAPQDEALPVGSGSWEAVMADLHRWLRKRDATDRQLALALERFREAGRALPDGVVILDSELRIEGTNPTAERYLGIDGSRDAGQAITNLLRHPDFVRYLEAADFREPLVLRNARSEAAVLALSMIAFGHDRRLLLARDITGEEKLDTVRRDFVANVSHELKTPITVLSGFVETLADPDLSLSEAQKARFLALMAEQSGRMRQLIDDLLTLSTLESSSELRDEAPVAVRPLLETLAEEARQLSGGRHRISCSIAQDAVLLASAKELLSALSNLVSNAIRYTPAGGTVGISWDLREGAGVFSVEDSGIGIEARHLPRLTERFYRIDSSRSRETGGTGLGLAIVKHVLTRHQATLEVRSEFGHGSTFSAVFPARRVQVAEAAPATAHAT